MFKAAYNIFIFSSLLMSFHVMSQSLGKDSAYYLVDSMDFNSLGEVDQEIIETALKEVYKQLILVLSTTERLQLTIFIFESLAK